MPLFLCCSTSGKSFPISPEIKQPIANSPLIKSPDDSANNAQTKIILADKKNHKLQTLFDKALLPGQLPDPSGDAAPSNVSDADKGTGVPLLEDTFCCSTSSRLHALDLATAAGARQPCPGGLVSSASAAALFKLHVPSHLKGSSASFTANYLDGEQLVSHVSFGDSGRHPPRLRSAEDLVGRGSEPIAPSAPNLGDLWLLMEPPFLRSVSRMSGQQRLHRQLFIRDAVRARSLGIMAQEQAVQGDGAVTPAGSGVGIETSEGCARMATEIWGAGKGLSCIVQCAALRQVQAELDTAEALPCCPLLLLPHRVYKQSDAVHVVYDITDEYADLHTFLRAQKRLPEDACRSIMRQLLQALSVLHERRWVHRNISTETVWIAATQVAQPGAQPQTQLQAQSSGGQDGLDEVELLSEFLPSQQPAVTSAATMIHACTLLAANSTGAIGHRIKCAGGWLPAPEDPPMPPPQRTSPCCSDRGSCSGSSQGGSQCSQLQWQNQVHLHLKLGGLAHAVRPEMDTDTGQDTPLRELLGCAYHLAPEAISGAGYGRPADVWAAGVLLYMLLTGRPPFPGRNELEVMTRVLLAVGTRGFPSGPQAPRPATANLGQDLLRPGHLAPAQLLPGQPVSNSEPQVECSSFSGTVSRMSGDDRSARGEGRGGDRLSRSRQPSDTKAVHVGCISTGAIVRQQQRNALQELVGQAVLEVHASAACREALAGMLAAEPKPRLTAAELLRLPWFAQASENDV